MSLEQAERLGADCKFNMSVTGLSYDPKTGMKTLKLSDGSEIETRAVVIAGGVQFRTLTFPGSDSEGVVYGDSAELIKHTEGKDALIVGGANSAGQAAIATAEKAKSVTILLRHGTIRDEMSAYLVSQIEGAPNIKVLENASVTSIEAGKDGAMKSATLKDGRKLDAEGVLFAIGSAPKTDWAGGVERDAQGYIKVGEDREEIEASVHAAVARAEAGEKLSADEIAALKSQKTQVHGGGAGALNEHPGRVRGRRRAVGVGASRRDGCRRRRDGDRADAHLPGCDGQAGARRGRLRGRSRCSRRRRSPTTRRPPGCARSTTSTRSIRSPATRRSRRKPKRKRKLREAKNAPPPSASVPDEYVPTDERGEPVGKDPAGSVPPRKRSRGHGCRRRWPTWRPTSAAGR